MGNNVKYMQSIGGGYYISITSGFFCVDVRKFFVPRGETDIKPTRQGIAFRLREWDEMKKIIETINNTYPSLGTALPCYLCDNHQNQEGALQCNECNPFYPSMCCTMRLTFSAIYDFGISVCVFVCVCVHEPCAVARVQYFTRHTGSLNNVVLM